jgi:hypothetical protein
MFENWIPPTNCQIAKKLSIKSSEFYPPPLEFQNFSDLHPQARRGLANAAYKYLVSSRFGEILFGEIRFGENIKIVF